MSLLKLWTSQQFVPVKEGRMTRGHEVTLAEEQPCRLYIRKISFSQRTVYEWNILSAECVDAFSVNMFIKIK